MKHTTFALLLFLLLLIGCKENTLELYDEEFIPEEIAYLHVIKNVDLQRSSTLKATFKGEPDPDYRVAKSVKGECCTYDPYLLESNKFRPIGQFAGCDMAISPINTGDVAISNL